MQNNIENIYSLTPMQAGMLYHKMVDEAPKQYFLQQVIRMNGLLDEDILKGSLALLSRRHDILRTQIVIPKASGKPRQVVLKNKEIKVNFIDLRYTIQDMREQELEDLINADIARGFDFEKDSLLRITYVRMADEKSVLIWSVHHIIVDGWSLPILFADFMSYYMRLHRGESMDTLLIEAEEKNKYSPRFGDYIKWQEQQDILKGLEYWEKLLQGYGSQAGIPSMKRNRKNGNTVEVVGARLDEKLSTGLAEFSSTHGLTMSNILEAAWGILLQRYNATDDAVFGKVISGRNVRMPGIEQMVGIFINTIPVRVHIGENTRVLELMFALQKQALDSEHFSYCALNEIQQRSKLGTDLFNTLYAFENYYIDDSINDMMDGIDMVVDDFTEQSNYPISLKCIDTDRVMMELTYDSGIYDAEEMQLLMDKMKALLSNIVEKPDAKVKDLACITDGERQMVLQDFNDSFAAFDYTQTMVSLFEKQASAQPAKEAVFFEHGSMSYGQLNKAANRIAHRLLSIGIKKGDLVALLAKRGFEMVAGMLGIMKAGAVYLPIDPDLPAGRIHMIIEDSGALAMATTGDDSYGMPAVNLHDETLQRENSENPGIDIQPNDLAYCIYTSGTTGMPKGILVEHRGVTNLYYASVEEFGLGEHSRILQYSNSMFDASVWDIAQAFFSGGTLCIVSEEQRLSIAALEEFIRYSNADHGLLPPHMLMHVDTTGMKTVLSGGSASSPTIVRMQGKREIAYYNAYGPTEITVCSNWWKHDAGHAVPDSIPIGKPIANVKAYILDGMDVCGIGLPGELCIGGEGVARGYLNRPELTAEKFIDNPFAEGRIYRTGDLARWLPDGSIEFMGRMDDQVKLRGYRIELTEIENALKQQEGILDASVQVRQDSAKESALYGYIVADAKIDITMLRSKLAEYLPVYMLPTHFMQLERLPLNNSGKVDKEALPMVDISRNEVVLPRNDEERELASIFGQVLGIEDVSVDRDFFELGGDSMKAIQISALLNKMSRSVSVKEIFQLRSIEQIATRLRNLSSIAPREERVPKISLCSDSGKKEKMDFDVLFADIDEQIVKYTDTLMRAAFESEEALSPSQMLTLEMGVLSSFGGVNISSPYDEKRLLSTWNHILEEYELLRCSIDLSKKNKTMIIHSHVGIDKIPFVDVSMLGKEEAETAVDRIKEHLNAFGSVREYNGTKPAHNLLCVKTDEDGFMLLIPISHLIFDAFSNEVLNGRLEEIYSGNNTMLEKPRPYSEYIELVKAGPVDISEKEMMNKFQLRDFAESLAAHREYRNSLDLCALDFSLEIPGDTDSFTAIRLAEKLAAAALAYTHPGRKVPMLMVHSGRNYAGHSFAGQLGEYIDFIPMVFDTAANEKSGILENAEQQLRYIRHNKISMAALAMDEGLRKKYTEISAVLDGINRSALELQVINLLMVYDMGAGTRGSSQVFVNDEIPTATLNNGKAFLNIIRSKGGILLENLECVRGRERHMTEYLADLAAGFMKE